MSRKPDLRRQPKTNVRNEQGGFLHVRLGLFMPKTGFSASEAWSSAVPRHLFMRHLPKRPPSTCPQMTDDPKQTSVKVSFLEGTQSLAFAKRDFCSTSFRKVSRCAWCTTPPRAPAWPRRRSAGRLSPRCPAPEGSPSERGSDRRLGQRLGQRPSPHLLALFFLFLALL